MKKNHYFSLLVLTLTLQCSILLAQPKERLKNRYREPSMSYGAPYTMFDLSDYTNNKQGGVNVKIEEIKTLITTKVEFKNYYRDYIYKNHINTPNPSPYTQDSSVYDPLATHAKNKAFIALVGVDADGVPLPPETITRLQNEAYSALENMNTGVLNQIIPIVIIFSPN